jgi:DNA repair ATPase RecN
MESKETILKEIETLLNRYSDTLSIDPYLLKYLSEKELVDIRDNIVKKHSSVIDDNLEWLEQFKSVK